MPYPTALLLTVVIEVPLYLAVLCRAAPALGAPRVNLRAALTTAAAANLISHPVAMLLVLPALQGPLSGAAALIVVEVAVLVFEAAVASARHHDVVLGSVASSVANLTSLTIGLLLLG